MMMLTSYLPLVVILIGFVIGKPVEQRFSNKKTNENISIEQAFRKSELTLKRYYYLMNSDTDHLVHAILHILINNPSIYPYVPTRALEIAFKNVANKIGQDDLDVLVKPMLIAMETNFQNKSKQSSSTFQLDDDIKEDIEDALDKFLDEYEHK